MTPEQLLNLFSILLTPVIHFLKSWWWVLAPFILWKPATFMWLWWRTEVWLNNTYKPIMLEIKIPKDVLKPIRAMENVLAGIHQATWEPPNWIEKWWEGQIQLGMSFEIVSIGGDIHFYVRCYRNYRDPVEANIYAQYPEAEITEVQDYTKDVPQDMPNKDWDFWATDYRAKKPDPYPILTYKSFETETEPLEEKRIDPVAVLLENLSKIKPGEQFWVQILASPVAQEAVEPFIKEGEALRDKLSKRPAKTAQRSIFAQAADILVFGKPPEEEVKEEQIIPPEMRLTPGERKVVEAIENKVSKPFFRCGIRFIYMGKKDVWFKPNLRLGFGFFANFNTADLNAIAPWGRTLTKVKSRPPINLFDKRRLYLRKRRIFRKYLERDDLYFPLPAEWPGVFVLNIEELASIFHFPSWQVSPVAGVPRVEIKKGPPPELPME